MEDIEWTHIPGLYAKSVKWDRFYELLSTQTKPIVYKMWGKTIEAKRRSCVFLDEESFAHVYTETAHVPWSENKYVRRIRRKVETLLFNGEKRFDYCLAHIYPDGSSGIGWHNDKEALTTDVISVSFGASRKFRLRSIEKNSGFDFEYILSNGDLFHMHPGCQKHYTHSIIPQRQINEPRINLTFRFVE